MNSPTPFEYQQHRAFAQAHGAHQDQLVQQYRVQLAVFETAVAVSVGVIALGLRDTALLQPCLMAWVLWQHRKSGNSFREAIAFRQKDVDWSQQELMLAETYLASTFRTFTRFKVYQDRDPQSLAVKEALFLADIAPRASAQDIALYFFSHKSQSRGKATVLLELPALATRLAGVAVMAASFIHFFRGLPL